MIYELPYRRLLVLTEGHLGVFTSKTAVSVLRYRPNDVVGVLDSEHAGRAVGEVVPGVADVPVFATVAETMDRQPDAVLIGIAPAGGALPDRMRQHVVDALGRGISIVSGLHTLLGQDPELAELAERNDAKLHDVRVSAPLQRIARGLARKTRAKRVLTVGTDCNCGKMVTTLELRRAAVEAGLDATFVATGQTGIMIEGWGIALDHVTSDFAAGAAEMLVEHVADRELCLVEGQGSIAHPGYSGVTLSLVHGVCPDAMVMCHRPGRVVFNEWADCPIPPITEQIATYEQVLAPLHPGKVVGVAVHTGGMSDAEAATMLASIAEETGLPTADPIRTGVQGLLAAIRTHLAL